jgi:hypothetical protein
VQWSGEPALYTKFHFGKYRGRHYDEIAASDPDYLRWIIEKSELEQGIKHSARHWLALSPKLHPSQPHSASNHVLIFSAINGRLCSRNAS